MIKCICCGKEIDIDKESHYVDETECCYYCEQCGDMELTYSHSHRVFYEYEVLPSERTPFMFKEVGGKDDCNRDLKENV